MSDVGRIIEYVVFRLVRIMVLGIKGSGGSGFLYYFIVSFL